MINRRIRRKSWVLLVPILAGSALAMSACTNAKTDASQCAYLIHSGFFDAAHVKDILYPGQRINTNNVTVYKVPCNARNYEVTDASSDHGDLKSPIQSKTGADKDVPGTPVGVELTGLFTLNESKSALTAFLPFCQKYSCFTDSKSDTSATNFSSPGWNGMLRENFQPVLNRAVRIALLKFGPNVWNDQSEWPAVGDAISATFNVQMQSQTGQSDDNVNFFCASGAKVGTCPPITIQVDNIIPPDYVKKAYDAQVAAAQQKLTAQAQQATNQAQLNAAKAKYGTDAGTVLGLLDEINACNASTHCSVILGTNGQQQVAAVTP